MTDNTGGLQYPGRFMLPQDELDHRLQWEFRYQPLWALDPEMPSEVAVPSSNLNNIEITFHQEDAEAVYLWSLDMGGLTSVMPEYEGPLSSAPIGPNTKALKNDWTGRRLRLLYRLMLVSTDLVHDKGDEPTVSLRLNSLVRDTVYSFVGALTWGELLERLENPKGHDVREMLKAVTQLPMRQGGDVSNDPELPHYLQDLADDWIVDVHEACEAFDNPDLWFPGIDPPQIEPVPDEHVHRVIAGLQRELNRELRPARSAPQSSTRMPAAPLAKLPFRIQRALVERRRWRFQQYGIGEKQFVRNSFSLLDVHRDDDWRPRGGSGYEVQIPEITLEDTYFGDEFPYG